MENNKRLFPVARAYGGNNTILYYLLFIPIAVCICIGTKIISNDKHNIYKVLQV